ncbi:MAG: eL32 family ribosomal protein [Candidatus Woesearchaeota archaeon]
MLKMSEIKKLLETRKRIKAKKPVFRKQDSHKKPKLSENYRRPRGLQSKMRLQKKGYIRRPKHGYGAPKDVRHMTKEGLVPFIVSNSLELDNIKPESECIIISGSTGNKKKIEIIKKAIEKKITIENVNDPKNFIAKIEESLKQKKEAKKKKLDKRQAKRTKKRKESESKKESVEEKLSEDDKKKKEKEEKDKILQKKQ